MLAICRTTGHGGIESNQCIGHGDNGANGAIAIEVGHAKPGRAVHISVGRQIAAEGAQQPVAAVGIGHAAGLAREHRGGAGADGFVGTGDHKNRIRHGATRRAFDGTAERHLGVAIVIEIARGVECGTKGVALPDGGRSIGAFQRAFEQRHGEQVDKARVWLASDRQGPGIANEHIVVTVAVDISGYQGGEGGGKTGCAVTGEGE